MIDDLLDLVLDVAMELGGEATKKHRNKKPVSSQAAGRDKRNTPGAARWRKNVDPWDLPVEKPPWEK